MKSINPIVYVVIGIIITSAAQIFLKIGSSFEIFKAKWSLYLFLSLLCYSISFLSYYLALMYFDISKISPVMMASIISIVALYGFLTGETLNLLRIIGIILAIISIIFISRS